jgi:Putative restriction endonuclease
MTHASLTLRRWNRREYDRLVELGVFEGEPLELIAGQLVVAEPQSSHHASSISAAEYAVRAILPPGWHLRTQLPVSLDDYRAAHPQRPALVVEVADSSLDFDRHHKGNLYARAGIQDYWIVNLVDRVLEVYRDPISDSAALHGWRYRSAATLPPAAVVVPLAFPSTGVAVAELLL